MQMLSLLAIFCSIAHSRDEPDLIHARGMTRA